MSKLQPITIQSIEAGDFARRINEQLVTISDDIIARPDLDKPRKLVMEISIVPNIDPNNRTLHPKIIGSIKPSIPPFVGSEMHGVVRAGRIEINPGGDFNQPRQDMLLSDDAAPLELPDHPESPELPRTE